MTVDKEVNPKPERSKRDDMMHNASTVIPPPSKKLTHRFGSRMFAGLIEFCYLNKIPLTASYDSANKIITSQRNTIHPIKQAISADQKVEKCPRTRNPWSLVPRTLLQDIESAQSLKIQSPSFRIHSNP